MAFGTVSSPHIFDVGSDVPKEITDKKVGVSREFAPKCLDDLIPVGQKDVVKRYCKEYRDLCARTGVRLAEESDGPNKCFGVMREGEVLGIHYDLDKWMWSVPGAKTLRLDGRDIRGSGEKGSDSGAAREDKREDHTL